MPVPRLVRGPPSAKVKTPRCGRSRAKRDRRWGASKAREILLFFLRAHDPRGTGGILRAWQSSVGTQFFSIFE